MNAKEIFKHFTKKAALQFPLANEVVSSIILGMGSVAEVEEKL